MKSIDFLGMLSGRAARYVSQCWRSTVAGTATSNGISSLATKFSTNSVSFRSVCGPLGHFVINRGPQLYRLWTARVRHLMCNDLRVLDFLYMKERLSKYVFHKRAMGIWLWNLHFAVTYVRKRHVSPFFTLEPSWNSVVHGTLYLKWLTKPPLRLGHGYMITST